MNHRYLATLLLAAMAVPVLADTKIMLPDPKRFADNDRHFFVETTMPGDFKSLDAVVFALLTLSQQAANKNLNAPFFTDTLQSVSGEKKEPLYLYFRGLRQKGKTVTLRFTGDAMVYLNSTIAVQDFVKGALEETVKLHAPGCKKVEYEIDGQVVDEWDA